MALTGYILAGGLLLGAWMLSAPLLAADEHCFADWSTAAPLVKSEGLATVEELSAKAARHLEGTIIKTLLCETGDGRWVYRLVVRERGGLRTFTVDARRPFGD